MDMVWVVTDMATADMATMDMLTATAVVLVEYQ